MNSPSVLIIDDEDDICFLLGKVLKEKKHTVIFAHSLTEGLTILTETQPSLLFLDLRLPDGSALDFLKMIRKQNPQLKIIIMSAEDEKLQRDQALDAGADLFIGKPLDTKAIDLALQKIQSNQNIRSYE